MKMMVITKTHNASFSLLLLVAVAATSTLLASADPLAPPQDLCKDSPFVGVCRAQIGSVGDPAQAFKASVKTLIMNTRNARRRSEKLGKTSEVCNENYADAEEELHTALAAYEKRDKYTVETYLSAALSDFSTCEDSWEEVKGAGTPLLLNNKILHRMASNCFYFENILSY